jgi:altronate dehydratase small subunit
VEFCSKFVYIGEMVKSEQIKNVILCHPKDNVATAKSPIKVGTLLTLSKGKKVMVIEEIPFGHKVALQRISAKGPVIKYGERIGRAIRKIEPGELVHIHNVEGERGKGKSKKKG